MKKQFLNQNIEEKRKLQFRTVKTSLKKQTRQFIPVGLFFINNSSQEKFPVRAEDQFRFRRILIVFYKQFQLNNDFL